jgi:hypothetical protein
VTIAVALITGAATVAVGFFAYTARTAARTAADQLTPNGNKQISQGGSVADAMQRQETLMHRIEDRLDSQDERLTHQQMRQDRQDNRTDQHSQRVARIEAKLDVVATNLAHVVQYRDPNLRTRAQDRQEEQQTE